MRLWDKAEQMSGQEMGKYIRGMRIDLGLTQAQLAGALGVHANTIARWERGEITPQYPTMLRYAMLYLLREKNKSECRQNHIIKK